jgi:hypothetical protein
MADYANERLILIVVGSTLRAEEADRPLAYYLKQQVEGALGRLELDAPLNPGGFRVLVLADFRWIHDEELHQWPTLSVGGPGVNALTQKWLEELPLSLAVDEQYYIQMDPRLSELRVSIWGMDNKATQVAVSAFMQRFLTRFLEHSDRSVTAVGDPEEEE